MKRKVKDTDYLRFRVVGMDEQGKFIDYPIRKVRKTVELIFLFKQLEDQIDKIHKIHIKKHDETGIIIGIDVQVKTEFDYNQMINTGVSNLNTPLDNHFKGLANNRINWGHILYCINNKKEILEQRVPRKHRNASQDDLIRAALVRGTR